MHSILQSNSNNHVSIKESLRTIEKKILASEFYFWSTKAKHVLNARGEEKLKSRDQQYLTRAKFFNPVPVRSHLDFHMRHKQPWKWFSKLISSTKFMYSLQNLH